MMKRRHAREGLARGSAAKCTAALPIEMCGAGRCVSPTLTHHTTIRTQAHMPAERGAGCRHYAPEPEPVGLPSAALAPQPGDVRKFPLTTSHL